MAFRDGPLVFSLPGASSAAGLEQAGDGVRALAMDATRTQHAQQNQPA